MEVRLSALTRFSRAVRKRKLKARLENGEVSDATTLSNGQQLAFSMSMVAVCQMVEYATYQRRNEYAGGTDLLACIYCRD